MLGVMLAAAIASQAPVSSGAPPIDLSKVVSLRRISEGVAQPPSRLTLPERTPDFVVEVNERQRFEHLIAPFLQGDFGTPARKPSFFASQPQVGTTPALASIDVLAVASAIGKRVSGARREREAGAARTDVLRAIAEYCAAQPNGGTAIRICMDPTSVR